MVIEKVTNSKEETIELAKKLARYLGHNTVVLLTGDLGAGKTTFVKGIAEYLKIKDEIISPTFNIMKCYFDSDPNLYHIDAYRLEDANKDIGLEEFIDNEGICVIEWSIYIKELLPAHSLEIEIHNLGENSRSFKFISDSKRYDEILEKLEGDL